MSRASARAKKRKPQSRPVAPGFHEKNQKPAPMQAAVARARDVWRWAGAFVLAGAAFVRLFQLTATVLHHDEGVNGVFLTNLFRTGYYHYDPANYHGPTLYYFAWITTTFNSFFYGKFGLSTFAMKLVPVLFGVGIVWLLLCLRRQLGTLGAIAAAALAAVSPGFVYFSRYFIHEILFVFFSLAIVVAVLRFRDTRQPRDLMLASLSAALLGATKETWVITVAVWLIAIPCTWAYIWLSCRIRKVRPDRTATMAARPAQLPPETAMPAKWTRAQLYIAAALVFVTVWVLFYSSFFTNFPQGVSDSVRTFTYWFKTSSSAHTYGLDQYFRWLWTAEPAILVLGGLGILAAFAAASNRFAVFAAFWSLGILAAYSLVPYKTPWLALNIVLPFIIMAGYGVEQFWRLRFGRLAAVLALATAIGFSLYQAIELSFFHYDDDSSPNGNGQAYPYVYAHSYRDLVDMVNEIDLIAAGNPAGNDIGITVMSPEHWPLPWYLRDYSRAGFWGKVVDTTEPILIVHEDQLSEVESRFGDRYRRIGSYRLRPGNTLFLYLRKDLQP